MTGISVRFKVPPLAESISEGTLAKWNKSISLFQTGDFIKQDEEIVTIETDKVDAPVNSPYSGKILELYANEQDTVVVGQDLCKVELGDVTAAEADSSKADSPEPEPKQKEDTPPPESKPSETPFKISTPSTPPPSQLSVRPPSSTPPPSTPPPSSTPSPPPPPSTPQKPSQPLSKAKDDVSPYGEREDRKVKMNRMRLRIAERLKESQNTAASLTTFNEIDMTNIIELRNTYKDAILKKHGVKLGFMSAFVKASTFALQEVPAVNASIAESGDTIIYRDYVDMSVAVATPKGLVTPVIRSAHRLSFIEIEKIIVELGQKARDGKMTIEDMAGGTFTISNGGVFGSLLGTPIINLPQSAILGMHATKDRPVAINGKERSNEITKLPGT
ncbi:20611_t:CDS:10, partial [Cetraspora pellucida]